MADRRDKLNKTLIMIGIVSAVVVIIIAKIFQMKPQSLISVIAVIWAALVVARMFIVNSKNKEYSKMLEHLNRILGEENDPERYIEMCNNYINRVDDESFKAVLRENNINISGVSDYCYNKLEEFNPKFIINYSAVSEDKLKKALDIMNKAL